MLAAVGVVALLVGSARAAIYMDEDFEGAQAFVDRAFPIQDSTTQPTQPLAQGINLRAWDAGHTTPPVQIGTAQGTIVSTRAFEGSQSYRLNSGQTLAVSPGQFPFASGGALRVWQFAVNTDSATTALTSGTEVGRFALDFTTDTPTDLTPEVTVEILLKVNGAGGVDLVLVNKANAVIGTLSGAADNWQVVTLVANLQVSAGTREDTSIQWGAYDPFTGTYKGPQPAAVPDPPKPLMTTGIHVFVDGAAPLEVVLTRAVELGAAWGNESGAADTTAEIGWTFAAENGGTVYLDNLSWDAGVHGSYDGAFEREQAARLTQFGEGFLASLPAVDSTIKRVYMVVHAHLDIGFTKPVDVVAEQYKTLIDTQVNYAKTHPGYKWTVEETWQLEQWLLRSTPQKIAEFVALEQAGQIRVAAAHSTLHSAKLGVEEMNRHLWNAARYRNLYDFTINTVFCDDVPAVNWSFPQVLSRSGIPYLVAGQNMFIGGGFTQPYKSYLCNWEGPDGSSVLLWSAQESYAEGVELFWWTANVDEAKLTDTLNTLTNAGYPYDAVMIQTAFDNSSATNMYDKVNAWNATHSNPQIIVATADDFFEYMVSKYSAQIPTRRGNWISNWDTAGIVGPRELLIAKNSQTLLPVAEQMSALAGVYEIGTYDSPLFDTGWDRVLTIDEHSGPGGSWPDYWTQAEVDANNDQYWRIGQEALSATSTTLAAGIEHLLGAAAAPDGDSLVVYNPLSWTRDDLARVPLSPSLFAENFTLRDAVTAQIVPWQKDAADSSLLFVANDVPSMGYKRYHIEHAAPPPPSTSLVAAARTIENNLLRVTLDDWGYVTSLYDKTASRELVDAADAFDFDRMIQGTNLQWFFGTNDVVPDPASQPTITIAMNGPVAASIRVTRANHPHPATEIVLYDGLGRVDFINTADRSQMLYASLDDNSRYYGLTFPFNLTGAEARIDTAAGWCNPRTDMIEGSYRSAFGIQNCLDLSEAGYGITFATPDVYSHAFGGFQNSSFPPSNPTVVSTFIRYGDEADLVGTDVGYVIDEPGAPPQWDMRHSIRPHARAFDPAAEARFGWEVASPLQGRELVSAPGGVFTSAAQGFFAVDAPNVLITSVKKADFGTGLIVKLQEIAGASSTAVTLSSDLLGFNTVQAVTPLEENIGSPLPLKAVTVFPPKEVAFTMAAREIRCLRIEPAALARIEYNFWMCY